MRAVRSYQSQLAALMFTLAAPTASLAGACLPANSDQAIVEGRLRLFDGLGGPAALILTVPAGVCLAGQEEAAALQGATTVQLYSSTAEGMQQLFGLVGQRVKVRGRMTAGSTFQQKAPILMDVVEIEPK